ncbi:hypothetical protein [Roseateles sp. L2-2]|uniref:hypothetical protein n=1 Tax=Roseateles sp. L2-2 TaxID=3422597 RepID=UPI003D35B419
MANTLRQWAGAAMLGAMGLLTGCGSMDNRTGVDRLPAAALNGKDQGVLLLSAGAPTQCVVLGTFLKVVDAKTGSSPDSVKLIDVDVYVYKSDYSDHHGTINAVALPPGKYEIRPVVANPYVSQIIIPNYVVEIAAGELIYGGEVFMPQACTMNTLFSIRDEFERDTELAIKKNPALAGRPVEKRLLQPGRVIRYDGKG